jgi:ABC-type transport system involved in multi-copper enzyme maturation permease subunit
LIRQTAAIFVDAYRELNAKKMFWIVLVLSLVCVGALASIGLYEEKDASGAIHKGFTIFFWHIPAGFLDYVNLPVKTFYNLMFYTVGFSIWLTWAATILALVSTSGIIPDFITGGSVEMVLSKPIGRLRLFLTKYLAGLLFVLLQVSVFAVASWLVIGLRAGAWEPVLFLSVPIVVAMFSFLFAFEVLIGMITRSAIAALLITICLWLCIWALHTAESGVFLDLTVRKNQEVLLRENDLDRFKGQLEKRRGEVAAMEAGPLADAGGAEIKVMEGTLAGKESRLADARSDQKTLNMVHAILYATKTVLPKTSETMDILRQRLVTAAELSGLVENAPEPQRDRRWRMDDVRVSERSVDREIERIKRERTVFWSLGTSLLFEACVVGIAAWMFCRRDF